MVFKVCALKIVHPHQFSKFFKKSQFSKNIFHVKFIIEKGFKVLFNKINKEVEEKYVF